MPDGTLLNFRKSFVTGLVAFRNRNGILKLIKKEGMNDSVKDEYESWKQKNGVNKTDYKKIKDDVKGLEYRIHPNICEFLHLDKVDKGAKGYDSMLNNAIVKILDLVRN